MQQVETTVWENTASRYFEIDESAADGSYKPKIVMLNLPSVEEGVVKYTPYEIPLFTLVKPHNISLEEMTMEFEVELQSTSNNAMTVSLPRNISKLSGLLSAGSNSKAKVMMKFKATDPQEGVMLINDKLMKVIPK